MNTILLVILILLLLGAAHVAVQRELGILSQRGHWIDSGDRCDPGGTRTYLTGC